MKIWSAACSIGCEPYTLGIILDKLSPISNHNIIATDIDNTILSKANIGEYTKNEMKSVNNADLNKYFKKEIYEKFSRSLKKGGLLFVGATESIYNYRDYGFEKASTFIYKKV